MMDDFFRHHCYYYVMSCYYYVIIHYYLDSFIQIESLYLSDDTHFTFGCDEAQTQCRTNRESGLAISHCCLNELSQATLAVLRECHVSLIQLTNTVLLLSQNGIIGHKLYPHQTLSKSGVIKFQYCIFQDSQVESVCLKLPDFRKI